jgi:tetratricopeptide (TPR) repeat protein
MKKLLILLVIVSFGIQGNAQSGKARLMPVTTSSKAALSLYKEAKKYFDDVKLDKAVKTFDSALEGDHDFFMANYQLAMYYLMNNAPRDFKNYAEAAIDCRQNLSDGEDLLKDAIKKFVAGDSKVTDIGKKLVELYPDDPESYNDLAYFQSIAGDLEGMIGTLQSAIKVAADPAPFYNQLGYACMALNQGEKAGEAFDKYVELAPDNPNAYDSMGDYYIYVKKYELAYESYMKANSMDPSFSHDKAEAAKQLYEQTEGKPLKIISM